MGIFVGQVYSANGNNEAINVVFPDNHILKVDQEKDLRNHNTMLEKIYSNDFSRNATINWLKTKQDIFLIKDNESKVLLLSEIKKLCPRGKRWEDPAQRDKRLEECIMDPLVGELRTLALQREPPFQTIEQPVKIGIAQPENGYANTCKGGIFFGKVTRLTNVGKTREITVKATKTYLCKNKKSPDLQLNRNDLKKLLGYDKFQQTEPARADILGPL